eukprot:scaffold42769_cov63-Attheya_sp.AAC.1
MLTGVSSGVPSHLHELMDVDTDPTDRTNYVRWVPYHMAFVITKMSRHAAFSPELRCCLGAISDQFAYFRKAKSESGDAWEALFLIVLLVRCLCGAFDSPILPLNGLGEIACVQYNTPFSGETFFSKKVGKFISGIPVDGGERLPAVSVYYPGNSNFETYDVIVATWDSVGNRQLYGYQCKEGSNIPEKFANEGLFTGSFLIRGSAATRSQSVRRWSTPSDVILDSFFGVSLSQWTPKAWRAFCAIED